MMYRRIIQAVTNSPWAIVPSKLETLLEVLSIRASSGHISDDDIKAAVGSATQRTVPSSGAIQVLQLYGIIAQRMGLMAESSGGTSTERFGQEFRQAVNNPQVSAIVVDVESPGGSVYGIPELAGEMFKARGTKPIVAVANSMAASAAYWLATAADEVVVTPSGEVGSIGVFAAHHDLSQYYEREGVKTTLIAAGKFKTEANPYEPLTEEAMAAIQESVDDYYQEFVSAVARHRGVGVSDVRGGFGEGRVVTAKRALKLGMVDRIDTLEGTINRLSKSLADTDRRRRRARLNETLMRSHTL